MVITLEYKISGTSQKKIKVKAINKWHSYDMLVETIQERKYGLRLSFNMQLK